MTVLRTVLLGFTLSVAAWKVLWYLIRSLAIRYTTVLRDVPLLKHPAPKPEERIQGNAVVVGGWYIPNCLGGLLTARILVDYFTNVTIIETDMNFETNGSRVGQRVHAHVYSTLSYVILQSLFSRLKEQAVEVGGVVQNGIRMTLGGSKVHSTVESLSISRLTCDLRFEILIRSLVLSYAGPSLKIIDGTVTGVKASDDHNIIESVLYRESSADAGLIHSIKCAFFADCSGPTCVSSRYLVSNSVGGASWGPFIKHHYNPLVSYVSALWHVPERLQDPISRLLPQKDADYGQWDKIPVVFFQSPTHVVSKEAFGIQRLDGDRLLFLHAGWGVDRLAQNVSELARVAHRVQAETWGDSPHKKQYEWVLDILNLIVEEEPDIDFTVKFMTYKFSNSHWVDFESGRLPDNFIAVGDSRMRVNPIFGQGVGKLLTDITILNTHFRNLFSHTLSLPPTIPPSFSQGYFDHERRIVRGIYDTNRAIDYGYESTVPEKGETREYGKRFREYWVDMIRFSDKDPELSATVAKVLNGVAPGIELFHPWIALRVYLSRFLSE